MASQIIYFIRYCKWMYKCFRENVKVQGFGLFVMAVYPGAFVDMCTDHLSAISPLSQLRIYCAGIWHNFILVLVALAVYYCLPLLMVPLYQQGRGVAVRYVAEVSTWTQIFTTVFISFRPEGKSIWYGIQHLWLTPVRASGCKNPAPILCAGTWCGNTHIAQSVVLWTSTWNGSGKVESENLTATIRDVY